MPLTQKQFETLEADLIKEVMTTKRKKGISYSIVFKSILNKAIESPRQINVEQLFDAILDKQQARSSLDSGYSTVITDGQKIILFCNFKPCISSLWTGKGVNLTKCCLIDITNGFEIIPDDALVHFNWECMLLLTQPYINENFVTNKIKFIPFRKILRLNPDVYKHVIDLEEVKAYYHRAKLFKEVVCR